MINSWQTISRGSCVSKAWKPPSSRATLIYFEFRSKPSLITVICMDPHSPNKLFATKYCFPILWDEFLFLNHFFIFRFFFFLLFYVILLLLIFTKTILLLSFYLIHFFFTKITLIFSCSGMFRNVPECSMFQVLSTPVTNGLQTWWLQFVLFISNGAVPIHISLKINFERIAFNRWNCSCLFHHWKPKKVNLKRREHS